MKGDPIFCNRPTSRLSRRTALLAHEAVEKKKKKKKRGMMMQRHGKRKQGIASRKPHNNRFGGVTVRVAPNSGLLLRNVIRRKSWLHLPSSFLLHNDPLDVRLPQLVAASRLVSVLSSPAEAGSSFHGRTARLAHRHVATAFSGLIVVVVTERAVAANRTSNA